MRQTMVTEQELAERSGVDQATIRNWVSRGLLESGGKGASGGVFLPEQMVDRIVHIQQLLELGYQEEEVARILRKVGPPRVEEKPQSRSDATNLLTVGALAESVGVSPRTIKHWEDKGIIEADARSEGGFRLFREHYIYLCQLIQDLQLFGYSLEQIKQVSDYFRHFLLMKDDLSSFTPAAAAAELEQMVSEIDDLFARTAKLREGIDRWEKLLNKQKRLIADLRKANNRRLQKQTETE